MLLIAAVAVGRAVFRRSTGGVVGSGGEVDVSSPSVVVAVSGE